MGDFFLREVFVETGHFLGEFDDVVDDEKPSVPEERIGELEEINSSFLLAVDEDHIERCCRKFREFHESVPEDKRGDIVHSRFFDILHRFVVGRKGIIDRSELSSGFSEREREVDRGIPVRRPYLEKILHFSDVDHIPEELGILV